MRILFCGYGGAHIRTQIPVIRKLKEETDLDIQVLALTTASQVMKTEGIPYIGYRDLLPELDANGTAAAHGLRLAADFPPNSIISPDETVAYLGLNYADLVGKWGMEEASRLYAVSGRSVFQPEDTMLRVLQERQIDMVIASNAPRTERALVLAAQRLGLPNLIVGDAFLVGEMDWLSDDGNVRNIAVFSEYVKRELVKHGRTASSIHVTGNPALDRLAAPETRHLGSSLRDRLGWQNTKVLTWALPMVKPNDIRVSPVQETLEILKQFAQEDPLLRVLVRPHPNNGPMFGALPVGFALHPNSAPVDEAIFCCDVLLTEFSMVGLEAAMAGKPVVTIASQAIVPYAELGVAEDVSSVAVLRDTLRLAFSGTIAPDLDRIGIPEVGSATQRVTDLILKILATDSKRTTNETAVQ
jgi:hypothetical protein